MINWFTQRGRKSALLLAVPAMALAFALLNTTGLTQSEQAENSSVEKDYEEVFSEGNPNGIVYINWQEPKATNDFSGAAWFLGAYRSFSGYEAMARRSMGICALTWIGEVTF